MTVSRAQFNCTWARRIYCAIILGVVCCVTAILSALWLVESTANERCYDEIADVPGSRVGLVLGCAPYLADGRENLFFKRRMEAAAELYHAGKVEYLLVSGDNSRKNYDESSAMKAALGELGVPQRLIYCDYAGFSTLDSIVRAKVVFELNELVVISQGFHVKRAVYIGQQRDVEVIGYIAEGVGGRGGFRTHLRECLARVKTVLDLTVLNRQPVYLGDTVRIGV